MDRSLEGFTEVGLAGEDRELCSVPLDRPFGLQVRCAQSLPNAEIPSKVGGGATTLLSGGCLRHTKSELMLRFIHAPQLTDTQWVRYYF
jgi:hypothetical protein